MIYYSLILNSSVGLKFISLGSNWCFSLTHGVNQLSFQLERAESSLTQLLCSGELFPLCLQKGGTLKALAPSKFFPSWMQLGVWILAWGSEIGDFFYFLDFLKGWTVTFQVSVYLTLCDSQSLLPTKNQNQKNLNFMCSCFPGFSYLRS